MEKIDRLVWADGFAFNCHGARVGIRVNEPAVLRQIPAHLPPGWKRVSSPVVDNLYSFVVGGDVPNSRVKRFHLLYAGSGQLARSLKLEDVFDALEADLDYRVAVGSRDRLFVRAGVVGYRGRAVVILGPHGGGRSTLVAAMVKAGATYYSDEYAVFDTRGRVHPYPRPLALPGENGAPPSRRSAKRLGGRSGRAPLPLGLIVVTEHKSGARWRPEALSPGQAVLALMEHTVPARIRPAFALEVLRHAVADPVALRGWRGAAAQVAPALLRRLEQLSGKRLGQSTVG